MRLIGISMVKNEGDIIEACVRHNLRFLDAFFIIDNGSADGTREILVELQREGLPVVVFDDPRPAYFQQEKMTALFRNVCEYTRPDYVVPLDADEFLSAESREALEAELAQLPRDVHGLIPWKTYICSPTPDACDSDANPVQRMTHRRAVEHPVYYKVIIRADAIENYRLTLYQGNHSVYAAEYGDQPHRELGGVALAHFPVRSESQLMTKVTCGWLAYLAKNPKAAESDQGYQWHDLYQRVLAQGGIAPEEMYDISMTYAQLPMAEGSEQGEAPIYDPLPIHYELRYQDRRRSGAHAVMARTMEDYLTGEASPAAIPGVRRAAGSGHILSSGAWEADFHLEHLFLDLPPFRYLADKYEPRSVLDVGCGLGGYIRMFRAWGAKEARGIDGFAPSDAFLSPGDFVEHDLSTPLDLGGSFDLVICTEVLEHIDARFEEIVLDTIDHHARDLILFSAAEPHQPGNGHINCKPLSHWLERWEARGWQPDAFESLSLRSLSTYSWFRRNLVVLKRTTQRTTPRAQFTAADLERLARMPAFWYDQDPGIVSFPLSEPLPPSLGDDIVIPTGSKSSGVQEQIEENMRAQDARIADLQARADALGTEVQALQAHAGELDAEVRALKAQDADRRAEVERLQAELVARDARIGQLEYAPPPTVTVRGIRQLVVPLGSRRYGVYKWIRHIGRALVRGRPATPAVSTQPEEYDPEAPSHGVDAPSYEDRLERAIEAVVRRVHADTMVAPENLSTTLRLVMQAIAHEVPGVLVECGVWRGGCSAAMLLIQREMLGEIVRPIYLLDSFEGLPPAVETKDGALAVAFQRQEYGTYHDNCRAGIEEARATLTACNMVEGQDFYLVPGWFDSTAPQLARDLRNSGHAIALLRLDGDWYESTWQCLEALEPLAAPRAPIVIDDYYVWDGCARAVHDYLSRRDLPYRVHSMPQSAGAYIIKCAAAGERPQ